MFTGYQIRVLSIFPLCNGVPYLKTVVFIDRLYDNGDLLPSLTVSAKVSF